MKKEENSNEKPEYTPEEVQKIRESVRSAVKQIIPAVEQIFPPANVMKLFRQADKLREAGQHHEAIKLYDEAIKLSPKFAAAWYNKALSHTHIKDKEGAIEALQKSAEADPNIAKTWNTLGGLICGGLFVSHEQYEEALEYFKKSIELDPEYELALNNHAFVLANLDRYDAGIEAYKRLIAVNETREDAWYMLGQMSLGTNRYEEAEEAYKKAIELKPDFAYAWGALGQVYMEMNDLDEAEKMMRKAVELKPNDHTCRQGLKVVLDQKRGYDGPSE
ncbi:MAG: tetratricopeptide repeat protein [Candidatus Thorarchaeota archaeon]